MSKLHSFTGSFLFLTYGLMACSNTESGTISGGDASTVAETDAPSTRDRAARDAGDDASEEDDSRSLRADAGSSQVGQPDAGETGGREGAVPETVEPTVPGTFSHIYEQAFRTCRTQCHGMGFSMLNMATRDSAYAQLVDQDSNPGNKECAALGLKRVKPGAPNESLLYLKLDSHAPCGQQMPPGGQLNQEFRDEVRAWITDGARDD